MFAVRPPIASRSSHPSQAVLIPASSVPPRLAAIVGGPTTVRAVPYRIEGVQRRHGIQANDRVPAYALSLELSSAACGLVSV